MVNESKMAEFAGLPGAQNRLLFSFLFFFLGKKRRAVQRERVWFSIARQVVRLREKRKLALERTKTCGVNRTNRGKRFDSRCNSRIPFAKVVGNIPCRATRRAGFYVFGDAEINPYFFSKLA